MVFLTVRVHPFPFRTRKLSSPVPTILAWRRAGKIGQRQHKRETILLNRLSYFSFGCKYPNEGLCCALLRFVRMQASEREGIALRSASGIFFDAHVAEENDPTLFPPAGGNSARLSETQTRDSVFWRGPIFFLKNTHLCGVFCVECGII